MCLFGMPIFFYRSKLGRSHWSGEHFHRRSGRDSSGYPDCRKEFYDAFNKVIDLGTKPETKISIQTPVIDLKKNEIVLRGLELNAPFDLTWSCYKNEDSACGVCDSCALRLRAFQLPDLRTQFHMF